MVKPTKLLRTYEQGLLTRHELLIRLCQAATECAPAEIAAELPADVLAEVREKSATPPDSPDHCRIFAMGSYVGDAEYWEQHFREKSLRLYDGIWHWHRYFTAATSNPPT